MASSGPNSPGTVSTSGGGLAWSNSSNITSSDNSYATNTISGVGNTQRLEASNFGFSIPSGATIDGITVEIERKENSGGGDMTDREIQLWKAGVAAGTNKSASATWSPVEAYVTFGSSSDLWGTTWTDSQINASNFGVFISADQFFAKGSATAYVDHIRVTITYTASGGGSSQSALLSVSD